MWQGCGGHGGGLNAKVCVLKVTVDQVLSAAPGGSTFSAPTMRVINGDMTMRNSFSMLLFLRGCLFAVLLSGAGLHAASAMSLDEFIEAAKERCEKFGYAPGSDGNARCVQQLVERAQARIASTEDAKKRCAGQITNVNGQLDLGQELQCRGNPDAYFARKAAQEDAASRPGVTCTRMLNTVNCF
jgi:hypothetical protein